MTVESNERARGYQQPGPPCVRPECAPKRSIGEREGQREERICPGLLGIIDMNRTNGSTESTPQPNSAIKDLAPYPYYDQDEQSTENGGGESERSFAPATNRKPHSQKEVIQWWCILGYCDGAQPIRRDGLLKRGGLIHPHFLLANSVQTQQEGNHNDACSTGDKQPVPRVGGMVQPIGILVIRGSGR